MKRQHHASFNATFTTPRAAAPLYQQQQQQQQQQQTGRIPQDFRETMIHLPVKPAVKPIIRTPDVAPETQKKQKPKAKSSAGKWKSSFKPLGDEDDSPETSAGSSERPEIYDPYDPISSDSEEEVLRSRDHIQSPAKYNKSPGREALSPGRGSNKKRCWGQSYSESLTQPLDRRDLSETRPAESRGLSPGHRLPERQAYSPNTESLDRSVLDHRVRSPDRHVQGSSTKLFPASYGGQRTNGEERIVPEHWREMATTVRLSPPRRDYQRHSEYVGTERDQIPASTEGSKNKSMDRVTNRDPIICDLCDVELANGRELEDHLESKSHWDTLEHIQQHRDYDDVAIAFLQEVMLHKSHQCSRAIEDSAIEALQENDHMTKIEMFHCAACSVFVPTSASSVQTHITSQEHLSNTKEFQVRQRRSCLDKAETIMKVLKPQFEHFLKGGTPFE
ncbi:A-kinase anchor protein 8-like [Plectropomus leopardus]|uniref:A-kinase anchor protein 8-like n=1 Tax=Plectropomus leopardus TaxID=160734 RepID=UPI001C4ABE86|nr:A-kinase anchor protein 8-like [Plectropomus leopardus]